MPKAKTEAVQGADESEPLNGTKVQPDDDNYDIDLLMDEAKTMLSVGGYHEHIVNLQGVTCEIDCERQAVLNVRLT